MLTHLKPFRIPLLLIVLCVGCYISLTTFGVGSEPQENESVPAMLGKLSLAQRKIADRAREFDIVPYGPSGVISRDTPVVGAIVQLIAQQCVLDALNKLHKGKIKTPAELALNAHQCQVARVAADPIARKHGIRLQLFGPPA